MCGFAKILGPTNKSLNIANGMKAVELGNSHAEYHQPQIVRVSREVRMASNLGFEAMEF